MIEKKICEEFLYFLRFQIFTEKKFNIVLVHSVVSMSVWRSKRFTFWFLVKFKQRKERDKRNGAVTHPHLLLALWTCCRILNEHKKRPSTRNSSFRIKDRSAADTLAYLSRYGLMSFLKIRLTTEAQPGTLLLCKWCCFEIFWPVVWQFLTCVRAFLQWN